MQADQPHHLLPQGRGGLEPPENGVGHLGAFLGVAVEVAPARFILGEAGDFAHVVEQRRPAQGQLRRRRLHHLGNVGEKVKGVVGAALVKANAGLQLRNHLGQHRGIECQIGGADQGEEFT